MGLRLLGSTQVSGAPCSSRGPVFFYHTLCGYEPIIPPNVPIIKKCAII